MILVAKVRGQDHSGLTMYVYPLVKGLEGIILHLAQTLYFSLDLILVAKVKVASKSMFMFFFLHYICLRKLIDFCA